MPKRALSFGLAAFATLLALPSARAGGGPMNVLVVYSADDVEATGVAKHYETARSLPPGHLCGLAGITPAQTTIDVSTYESLIHVPLEACLAALPQPDEIDYLVLVRGLPYAVTLPAYAASLEAVLQVHRAKKTSDDSQLSGQGQPKNTQASVQNPVFPQNQFGVAGDYTLMNQYQSWYSSASTIVRAKKQPPAFHRAAMPTAYGYAWKDNLFIVSSLDGFDYADATALVDRGVASDGAMPTAEILCMAGEDPARQARDPECEFVKRMLAMSGLSGTYVTPFDANLSGHTVAAYFTGSADSVKTAIAGNTFVPGAITDNLTSYGAVVPNFFCNADGTICPENESQTSIARFIRAGATGSHGTVNEPLNNNFPNAGTLLHYTFGYSLGESYFMNQRYLYWQDIFLGDPLATPYGVRPKVSFEGGADHPLNQPIVVHATHPDGVASVDLFSAGKRVASTMGDTLSYEVVEALGTKLDLLAVAIAKNAPVMRAGWAEPAQAPQPDVQGWTTTAMTIAPAAMGTGGSSSSGAGGGGTGGSIATTASASGSGGGAEAQTGPGPEDSGGCGCRIQNDAESPSFPAMAAIAALALSRRKRRRRGV